MASVFKRGKTWRINYYFHGKQIRRSLKTTYRKVAEREKQAIEANSLSDFVNTARVGAVR